MLVVLCCQMQILSRLDLNLLPPSKLNWYLFKCLSQVYMNVPLEVCEARDSKGLYKLARAGKIKGMCHGQ